ncbi:MAG: ester cyclase [Chloroflexi bacterium]|nr:ester cyclase [Chloroflexota bacterium]MBV9894156.1 ester cyclase [Chloroflexota bacterium]
MTASATDRTAANLATVSKIYAAFVRGDVPAILDRIAPDCRWEIWDDNRAQRAGVPTLQPRVGPAAVAEFFAVAAQLQMHDFKVLDTTASQQQVVAEVEIDYTTPTGQRLRDQELHLWTLDEQQQVIRLRHYVDTAKHIAAFAAGPAASQAVARRFVLEHNQADYRATFDELLAPGCVVHEYLPGVPPSMDRAGFEQFIAGFRAALPDIHNSVEEISGDADTVTVRWTGRGTHTGASLMGVPPSGKSVTANGVYVFRISAGRVVEVWDYWDNLNVLQQLGGLPG